MIRFKPFDIIVIPFYYSDSLKIKNRPALVLSMNSDPNEKLNFCLCLMITSLKNKTNKSNKPRPLDVPITDLKLSGLPVASVVRMKFFTVGHQMVSKKIGELSQADIVTVKTNSSLTQKNLRMIFPIS